MINALIIDDEEKAIVVLRRMLKKHCPEVNIIAEADEVNKATRLIETHRPQLLFLDIEMNGKSGFDLLESQKYPGHVIFVTAHSEFAVKAFRFSVTDYLLKPVGINELKEAVQKVKKLMEVSAPDSSSSYTDTLRIPSTNGLAFAYINHIIRMEADGAYTHIYVEKGKHYMSSYHLKQFEVHLDSSLFVRVHRSHLINLDKIKAIIHTDGLIVEMMDGTRIEVPRRSKEDFLKKVHLRK